MPRRPIPWSPVSLPAVASLLAAALSGSLALAEAPKPTARSFEIRRATGPVEIDGVLDEAAWSDALTFDVPYEWSPGDNVEPPRQPTGDRRHSPDSHRSHVLSEAGLRLDALGQSKSATRLLPRRLASASALPAASLKSSTLG